MGKEHLLVINAGDNFSGKGELAWKKAELIIKVNNLMGTDLIALGAKEYRVGAEKLSQLAKSSCAPFICANLKDHRQLDAPYFMPFLRFERGGRKILVVSVIDPAIGRYLKDDRLELTDPLAAVRRLQRTISHDVFILIANAQSGVVETWLKQLNGIDLAIMGRYIWLMGNKCKRLGPTMMVANNNRGKTMCYVDLDLDANGRVRIAKPVYWSLKKDTAPKDPLVAALVADYQDWEGRYHYDQRSQRLRQANADKPQSGRFYLGKDWCRRCHGAYIADWRQTRHARALDSLRRKKREFDPECLPCHVTGMNDKKAGGGFADAVITPQTANVQCEACHGPAGAHALGPEKNVVVDKVTEKTCRRCHNRETDPNFDYQRDLPKVNHSHIKR